MNAPLHASRLAPAPKIEIPLGVAIVKSGDYRIEASAHKDGTLSLWSANTGKVLSLDIPSDQLDALIEIAQKAKKAVSKSPEKQSKEKPIVTPEFVRKQVRQETDGWCVTFLSADGQKSLAFFYKSRSLARAADTKHKVGEAGRIK